MKRSDDCQSLKVASPLAWLAIALAFLPVFAKRAALIGEPDVIYWLAWDYSWRFVSLAGVILAYDCKLMGPPPNRRGPIKSAIVFALGLAAAYLLVRFVEPMLDMWLPYFQYFRTPYIRDAYLLMFDLSSGFCWSQSAKNWHSGACCFRYWKKLGSAGRLLFLASSTIFALTHLTSGLAAFASTFLYGIIFAMTFYATGRLSLCIALHYIVDFVVFNMRAMESGVLAPATSS